MLHFKVEISVFCALYKSEMGKLLTFQLLQLRLSNEKAIVIIFVILGKRAAGS